MKYTLVYQDVHCYNALRTKVFKSLKALDKFLEDESNCPPGERMDYIIFEGEVNYKTGSVDNT